MRYTAIIVKRGKKHENMDVFVKNGWEERYLSTYRFRLSVYSYFQNGVAINALFNLKSKRNPVIAHFIRRLLPMLKYFEKECGAEVFRDKEKYAERKLRFCAAQELDDEYMVCVNNY